MAVRKLSSNFVAQKKKEKPKSLDFLNNLTGLNIPKKRTEKKVRFSGSFKVPYDALKTKEVIVREPGPSIEDILTIIVPLIKQHLSETGAFEFPVTSEVVKQIIQVMHSLPENDKLEVSKGIRNAQSFIYKGTKYGLEEMMHGSGTASAGATLTAETPVGTIDDSNTVFTVTNTPLYIVVNGAQYTVGTGIFSSYSGGTIILSSAVGTGGFIKSFYNA